MWHGDCRSRKCFDSTTGRLIMTRRETIWSALRLAVIPTSLAKVASRISLTSAFGCFTLSMTLAILISISAGVVARIFDPTMPRFSLGDPLRAAAITVPLVLPLFSSVVIIQFFVLGSLVFRWGVPGTLMVLTPITVLVPLMIWSITLSFDCMRRSEMGSPPWLSHPVIRECASLKWLLISNLIALGLALDAARRCEKRHSESRNYPLCESCDYNLTGNTSGTCPECGTPVPPSTSAINQESKIE